MRLQNVFFYQNEEFNRYYKDKIDRLLIVEKSLAILICGFSVRNVRLSLNSILMKVK